MKTRKQQTREAADESPKRKSSVSRRDFLAASSVAGVSVALGLPEKAFGATGLVGLARASSIEAATNTAIANAGGLPFNASGATVLLKLNLNTGDPSPYSPSPSIVSAIIKQLKSQGAKRIIFADRSNPSYNTLSACKKSGIYSVGIALGAEFINFADYSFRKVTPSGATHWSGGFSITSVLNSVNYVINVCCCKHHVSANFTMALKAWMGIIPQSDRSRAHSGDIRHMLPELHLGRKENFVVMDATKICLTKGPNPGGASAAPGIVVASKDPIANDVTGLAILKYYLKQRNIANTQITNYTCWTQPQIVRATQIGLGIKSKSAYTAAQSGVTEWSSLLALINA